MTRGNAVAAFEKSVIRDTTPSLSPPFGRHVRPHFPRIEMQRFVTVLRRAAIVRADFRDILARARYGDFVYCDPPYSPSGAAAGFTTYAPAGFTTQDHRDLAECCAAAARRGAHVLISNHDSAFTRDLYRGATSIRAVTMPRTISRRADRRKPARELLICYAPRRVTMKR